MSESTYDRDDCGYDLTDDSHNRDRERDHRDNHRYSRRDNRNHHERVVERDNKIIRDWCGENSRCVSNESLESTSSLLIRNLSVGFAEFQNHQIYGGCLFAFRKDKCYCTEGLRKTTGGHGGCCDLRASRVGHPLFEFLTIYSSCSSSPRARPSLKTWQVIGDYVVIEKDSRVCMKAQTVPTAFVTAGRTCEVCGVAAAVWDDETMIRPITQHDDPLVQASMIADCGLYPHLESAPTRPTRKLRGEVCAPTANVVELTHFVGGAAVQATQALSLFRHYWRRFCRFLKGVFDINIMRFQLASMSAVSCCRNQLLHPFIGCLLLLSHFQLGNASVLGAYTDDVATVVDDHAAADDGSVFHPQPYQVAGVIFAIITFLVVVTVVFEIIKDFAIENSDKYTRSITLTLFSEMTVMGFLSVCAFAVTYSGALETLSEDLFGSSAPMYIIDKLIEVQYCLFLVLILIVLQVFGLVYIGNLYSENFRQYNELSQDKEKMARYINEIDLIPNVTYWSWTYDYLVDPLGAWAMHNHRVEVEEVVLFYSLRAEALLRRSPLPPYKPERKDRQLPANFDFATYLSLCLSDFLTKVVTLTPLAWSAALLFSAVFYGILVAMDGEYLMVTIMWICIGYVSLFVMLFLGYQTNTSFEHLLNPGLLKSTLDNYSTKAESASKDELDDSEMGAIHKVTDKQKFAQLDGAGDKNDDDGEPDDDSWGSFVNLEDVGNNGEIETKSDDESWSPSAVHESRHFGDVDFQSDFIVTPTVIGNLDTSLSQDLRDNFTTHAHTKPPHYPRAENRRPSNSSRAESTTSRGSQPKSDISFGVRPESVASFGVGPEGEGSFGIRTASEVSFGVGPPSLIDSEVSFGIQPLNEAGSVVDAKFDRPPATSGMRRKSVDEKGFGKQGNEFENRGGKLGKQGNELGNRGAEFDSFRLEDSSRDNGRNQIEKPSIPQRPSSSVLSDLGDFMAELNGNVDQDELARKRKHFLKRTKEKDLYYDGEARPSMFPDWKEQLDQLEGRQPMSDSGDGWDLWRWIDPVPPTVQERLFMGGKYGPALNIFCVRLHIMLQSLYASMVLIFFIPYIFEVYGSSWGALFLIVALLPLLMQYMSFYSRMVIQMVMMSSSGCLLDTHRQKDVTRLQKLQKVVQLMMMLTKIKNAQAKVQREKAKSSGQAAEIDPKLQAEMDEVGRIFDKYDTSGDGELDIDELRPFVQSMGMSVDEVSLHRLFVILDADGSGSISKEELLEWRMSKYFEGTPEEEMKKVYVLFLEEGQTEEEEISITRFREVLESFNNEPYNANLSEKEIEEIVQDFDEDESGWISFEEFSAILKEAQEME